MTYSDLNKLLKKHRSLANDLADRLEIAHPNFSLKPSFPNCLFFLKHYQVDQSAPAREAHEEGHWRRQDRSRKHKELPEGQQNVGRLRHCLYRRQCRLFRRQGIRIQESV